MASFIDPQNGDLATAEHVAQLVEDFQGLRNIPISLSGINDAATYALTLKNAGTGSRDLIAYAADGTTVLLQVDATGVTLGSPVNVPPGSISGSAISAGSITNAMLGPTVARDNQCTNGGFEIWQRGNGPFTANNAYSADRWMLQVGGGGTLSVSRDQVNILSGNSALACVVTAGGAAFANVQQKIEPAELRNIVSSTGLRKLTFSVKVRTSTANAAQPFFSIDGGTTTLGAFHPGDGTYRMLTVTIDTSAINVQLLVGVIFQTACTAYIDQAMLVIGDQPADYVPMHPADDLARCLRYYEPLGGAGGTDIVVNSYAVGAATLIQVPFQFRAVKAVVPTVTKNGTWGVVNSAQPVVNVPTVLGFYVGAAAVAAGMVNFYNTGPGTNFTAESNP